MYLHTFSLPDALPIWHQSRQVADLQRKALEPFLKVHVVLSREQGSGADQCHLHPRHRGNESSPQRHFRLAKADIAADEAIHGPSRRQILDHIIDGAVLRSEEHTSELQSLMRIS